MRITWTAIVLLISSQPAVAQWAPQPSGTTARLRGLSVVNEKVAWASGAGGTIIRTTDGGSTWVRKSVPHAEALDFRDIEAFDERTAYALSIGPGELSRIYRTADGGATWSLLHVNLDPGGFLDAWPSGTRIMGWPWATRWAGGSCS